MGKQDRTMADTNRISTAETDARNARARRVVIVGGGFGGLAAAKARRKAPVQIIRIDRLIDRKKPSSLSAASLSA